MTRDDPELGPVRRCNTCGEWWPDDIEFFAKKRRLCRACRADRERGRPIPKRPATLGSEFDQERKRQKDRERKAALRRDPVFGEKMRARQRLAQQRFYERNKAVILERHRQSYAAKLDRPVREGFGRPRIAA